VDVHRGADPLRQFVDVDVLAEKPSVAVVEVVHGVWSGVVGESAGESIREGFASGCGMIALANVRGEKMIVGEGGSVTCAAWTGDSPGRFRYGQANTRGRAPVRSGRGRGPCGRGGTRPGMGRADDGSSRGIGGRGGRGHMGDMAG